MKKCITALIILFGILQTGKTSYQGQKFRRSLYLPTSECEKCSVKPRNPTYIVIAPVTVHPTVSYPVFIKILKSSEEINYCSAQIKDENGRSLSSVARSIRKGKLEKLVLEESLLDATTGLSISKLKLDVSCAGLGGRKTIFHTDQLVNFMGKSLSIFVQTDRAIYDPGTTVQYRVIVLNPSLKPYKDRISVRIVDPNGNIIQQHRDKELTKGVFSSRLELSMDPPLGGWTIKIQAENDFRYEKKFTVEKYILPKFDVKMEAPKFITDEEQLVVAVTAKYTYGKGVNGKAKVTILGAEGAPDILDHVLPQHVRQPEGIERSVTLSHLGKGIVVFEKEEVSRVARSNKVIVSCTVQESITGATRNTSAEVTRTKGLAKLRVKGVKDVFKPGLSYRIIVDLNRLDGEPLFGDYPRGIKVASRCAKTECLYPGRVMENVQNFQLDQHFRAVLNLTSPTGCMEFHIEVSYDRKNYSNVVTEGNSHAEMKVKLAHSYSERFIQVLPEKIDAVKAGESVFFNIESTAPLTSVTYLVKNSLGSEMFSKEISMERKHARIGFPTSADLAPRSQIVVFATENAEGELLADSADFEVTEIFKNKVLLSMNRATAEPGKRVRLTVKSDPQSFVGLLAVDQSALLLQTGNDITQETVLADLAEYDPETSNASRASAQSAFKTAGFVMFTDAYSSPSLSDCHSRRSSPPSVHLTASKSFHHQEIGSRSFMKELSVHSLAAPKGFKGIRLELVPKVIARRLSPPKLRSNFPETWIWADNVAGEDGSTLFEATVPDTITSWIASAFAVNDITGLGVAAETSKLTAFRPFFIRLNLPSSIKRGENFALQVLVFNYMEEEQQVSVTLKHSESSGFDILMENGTSRRPKRDKAPSDAYNVRHVSVPGGGSTEAVYFPIIPTTVGHLKLSVTAQSDSAGDAVMKSILVEPEGYRIARNAPILIKLNGSTNNPQQFSKLIQPDFPKDVVDGSKKARIDVIGDMMGPALLNLGSLVKMPHGCGEQNMVDFVPNIVVLKYLKATNRADSETEAMALKFMRSGYQQQLNYLRQDGSFSIWGQSDAHGSTWLTAFVAKSFRQAQKFITIDGEVLEKSIRFLKRQQQVDGSFKEEGRVYSKSLQGGAAGGSISITAYVLTALIENENGNENKIENRAAQNFLEKSLQRIRNDVYTLAIVTYALQLSKSSARDVALKLLEVHKTQIDDKAYWSADAGTRSDPTEKERQPKAVDIEITAYALLSYLAANEMMKASPVAKWLSSQRNSAGGFQSTQDTVLALQSLGSYAEKVYSPSLSLSVKVKNGRNSHTFTVSEANANVLQSYELPNVYAPVELEVNGHGTVYLQVHYSYHQITNEESRAFSCTAHTNSENSSTRLRLRLCCRYKGLDLKSNMVIAEIDALTGFRFDAAEISQQALSGVQRTELVNDDKQLNIYFYSLGYANTCVSVHSDTEHRVTNQRPAKIVVYDYYDPQQQAQLSYGGLGRRSLQEACPECW